MKKSLFAAALLFSFDTFADIIQSPDGNCYQYDPSSVSYINLQYSPCGSDCNTCLGKLGYQVASTYNGDQRLLVSIADNRGGGYCIYNGTSSKTLVSCPSSLSSYDNDPAGCSKAGGYYTAEDKCLSLTDFGIHLFTQPSSLVGSALMVNGMLFMQGAGIGATLYSAAGLGMGAVAIGTLGVAAFGLGAGYALYGIGSDLLAGSDPITAPSPDVTVPEQRIRIKITELSEGGAAVAKTDTDTGKVQSVDYIPSPVIADMKEKARYLKGGDLYNPAQPMAESAPAVNPTGIKSTTYDYATNTATTKTVTADGTTKIENTPISTTTNLDGTVTTSSANTAVAPSVTGTKQSTSENPNWNAFNSTNLYSGSNSSNTLSSTGDNTADAIINASMPEGNFEGTGDFDAPEKGAFESMIGDATETIENLQGQFDTAKENYEELEGLLEDGFDAPSVAPGQCGSSLKISWHGRQIDLCPPITQNLSVISPVFSFFVSLLVTILAIRIFMQRF